jgi:hypothetical protein
MLVFSPAKEEAAVKEQYTRSLVAAVVRSNFDARYVMFRPSVSGSFFVEAFDEYVQRFTFEVLNSSDLLAAAAVVGDISTVQRYISEGVSVLNQYQSGLCNPIVAAASVGNVDSLKVLLAQATKEIDNIGPEVSQWKQRPSWQFPPRRSSELFARFPLGNAAKAAIDAKKGESAIMLIEFLPEYFRQCNGRQMGSHSFFVDALDSGSIDIADWLLKHRSGDIKSNDSKICELHLAFGRAVASGDIAIVRYLLESNLVKPNTSMKGFPEHDNVDPLTLAVLHGHRAMIKLFLDYSVRLKSSHFSAALDCEKPHVFLTVQCLFELGVLVDMSAIDTCESLSEKLIRQKYKKRHESRMTGVTNLLMTLVLMGMKMREQTPANLCYRANFLAVLLADIAAETVPVPTAPLPFKDIAADVIAWRSQKQYEDSLSVSRSYGYSTWDNGGEVYYYYDRYTAATGGENAYDMYGYGVGGMNGIDYY